MVNLFLSRISSFFGNLFRSNLRRQLWLLLSITILIILLTITILTSSIMRNYVEERVLATSENLVYQGGENLEYYLKNVENASLIPYTNSSLYSLLASESAHSYSLDPYVKLALRAVAVSDPSICQVRLYVHNISWCYLLRGATISSGYTEENGRYPDFALYPLHRMESYGVNSLVSLADTQPVVTLHRTLYRVPEGTLLGYLDVDMDLTYFSTIMEKLRNSKDEDVYLFNADGEKIFSISDSKSDTNDSQWLTSIPAHEQNGIILPADKFEFVLIFKRITVGSGELLLVKSIPYQSLTAGSDRIIRWNILVAILCLVAASIVTILISAHFTAPIQQLVKHMERIGCGEMTERISSNRADEIGSLFTYFQSMMDNINDLIRQQYQLELSNKTNQLLALQAQLNPHFIHNTIQSIGTIALQQGNREIYEQLSQFGSMMHYCMDFQHPMVPLAEELTYVQNYLSFQKARFSDRFVYAIHVPEELLAYDVPRMLLQPIVENSFKHGHLQNRENGFILIVGEYGPDSLTLTVDDNGDSADEEELSALRNKIVQAITAELVGGSAHIGLLSIANRIRLHYGDTAQLRFGNRPRGGFTVSVTLPIEKGLQ